ncbi:MAG TPA: outer membrane protein assembly factor BamD [Longimicrobiaceae bacterium]|nr:outer membrane protein assembly factor BamD [Longimicrobiaceae bacterium]
MTKPSTFRGPLLALLLLCAAALPGCSIFRSEQPISPETMRQRGLAAHQAGEHRRAVTLLAGWTQQAAGDPRLPEALQALGESYLETGEYVSSAASFLRLVTEFPTDPRGQAARFGMCRAYQRLSPKAPLDQDYTHTAIAYCESFASIYPATPEAQQARGWVTELTEKLARKTYDNGMFYFRRQAYDAAVIYFNETLELYPGTRWAPAALLKLVETYDRIGYREEATEARARLRRDYPNSDEARSLPA